MDSPRTPLDPELAALYLAAAMQEAGFVYDLAAAATILDYLEADANVALARLQSTDPSLSPEVGESEGEDARA